MLITFKNDVVNILKLEYGKTIKEADTLEMYHAVSKAAMKQVNTKWELSPTNKTACYFSAEFLIGRLIYSNLLNLGLLNQLSELFNENNIDFGIFEDIEDAALGNGGLGRLAACFLDSAASQGIVLNGYGIRYKYGLFKQYFEKGFQMETADDWQRFGDPWSIRRDEDKIKIKFKNQTVYAVPYDTPVIGYGGETVNTLRLWQAEAVNPFDFELFNEQKFEKAVKERDEAEAITSVLYPNDSTDKGKKLRLKQQYFFCSASLQDIIKNYKKRYGNDFSHFSDEYAIQLNDTHPVISIAEFIRILVSNEGVPFGKALKIARQTFAYTNHTIMAEALEKWPIELFSKLLPRIYQIIEEINRRFIIEVHNKYDNAGVDVQEKIRKMAIIYDGQVRMANLAIVAGFSVNGVAKLHTEILENKELHDFYEMYPDKFSNKTNGITQRRFLLHGNRLLAAWVTDHVGDDWITDLGKIADLKIYADDPKAQKEFMQIKYKNKQRLAKYILDHNGIEIDPHSIYDVQVKRLHEYKRQLLNILHVMYLYNQLKADPNMKMNKRTFIFGAKAAAGYRNAKLTIKLINSVADVINNDPSIDDRIKVVFIEDYKVSNGEIIFSAADVSEQISTASKEASGTGNMKLMLNGAVTIGTLDGANVEMLEEVGKDNMFIFGLTSEEVINYENNGGYDPYEIFNSDQNVRQVLMQLVNGTYSPDDPERFRPLYDSLLKSKGMDRADRYFILKDFEAYAAAQRDIDEAYSDQKRWARMALMNTASSGKFSSDRTIEEYVRDIWHLDKMYLDRPEPREKTTKKASAIH